MTTDSIKTKLLILVTLLFAGTAFSARVTNPKRVPRNAVLLSKVSAITVRAGKQTTSRRVAPVPQLRCVGPSRICKLYSVDAMRCTNEGADYDENNIQWSCKASLPEEFKLGSTDVTCEGYESSEDPYVLSGSCGVEYRLLLTEKGEEKYGSPRTFNWDVTSNGNAGEAIAGFLFMAVFVIVLFTIVYGFYKAWRNDAARRTPRPPGGGFGGFGGGGDDDDPPPPYDPRPPPRPKKATWSSSSRSGYTFSAPRNENQGWRPGFWTGTAAGAAAGYLAGRGARTQPEPPQTRPATGGWFGGRGATRGAPSPSTSASSSSSYSSARHESIGFGGTSRR
ncbi:uncharacterized protein Z518_04382 [Rhinocladiella mackenziei CBS 650.93]|uniref:Store-operated calcium entry-associated regulatory factor n=1 Tax=Rhinocladiella mackenziei CBS 650.93 TaxID=1442369 RepID=A0A0D2ITA6_9EURO|nr:uncharacterized protein Z518_04382 [Rhinocladiella mackenziei CBS 650.93]KIX06406.1 hypothetical protein Z518_04382 [Rhinocladiella mackenziei CBS 650.93]